MDALILIHNCLSALGFKDFQDFQDFILICDNKPQTGITELFVRVVKATSQNNKLKEQIGRAHV